MKFAKHMLNVSTLRSPDGEVEITEERLKHWADTFKAMTEEGLAVPMSWGHSDDPAESDPIQFETPSDRRKRPPQDTVGYLDDFKLSEDGKSAELILDIRGKENSEKAKDNLAFVSPVIRNEITSGKGTTFKDFFGHVDLVQYPVDSDQGPFRPVESSEAIACGIRMGIDDGNPVTYRMADDSDAEDKDDSESDEPEEATDERLVEIIDALTRLGIVLSDDTSTANFLEHLHQALLTKAAMEDDDMSGDETEVLKPQVAALSADAQKYQRHADSQLRDAVSIRLSALLESGRCTPAEHKDRLESVPQIRLSLDDDGRHQPTRIETWIESREAVPPGTFWDPEKRTRMANEQVVDQPGWSKDGEELSEEQADELINELFVKK